MENVKQIKGKLVNGLNKGKYVWISSKIVIGVVQAHKSVGIKILYKRLEWTYLTFKLIQLNFIVIRLLYWELVNSKEIKIKI